MLLSPLFVGIDVAKAHLVIALRPSGECWTVTNDEARITSLVTRLQTVAPALIVLEATGGYQRAVVAALAAAGLPLAVVPPARSATSPKPPGSWPARMPSTHGLWPILPRRSGRPRGPCLLPKPMRSARCWRGSGN